MALQKTQVIKSSDLAGFAVVLAWIFGVIAPVVFSIIGNYVTFDGAEWERFSWLTIFNQTMFYAFLWQAASTAAQFGFKAGAKTWGGKGWWIAYVVSLLVSVVPSFIAYYTLMAPITLPELQSVGIPDMMAIPLVAMFVLIGCTLFDMLPEWVAVEGT